MRASQFNSFFKYSLVGCVGFMVDAGALLFLDTAGMNSLLSRAVSISLALVVTWLIHRNFTFNVKASPTLNELFKYIACNAFGAAINYITYSILYLFLLRNDQLIAMFISSFVALAFNYSGAKRLVFQKPKTE